MIITSKYESRCKRCSRLTYPGDQVGWEPGQKGVWCLDCTPAATKGQPIDPWKNGNGKPATQGQTPYFAALVALEAAIIDNASTTMTPELSAGWDRIQKLKALALAPGTAEEGRVALKQALIAAIKIAL